MTNLNDIISYFETEKTPTYEEFKKSWTSFFHKSEKFPLTQVVGLNDVLDGMATKDDLQSVMGGIVPMGNVANIAELNTKPKRNNDSYFVLDQLDENGNPYIFRYDAELNQWINTKQVVYKDAAKKEDIEFSSVFPYQEGQKGKHIPILKKAIKGLFIYPEFLEAGKQYRIVSIVRKADLSQVTLAAISANNSVANIERFENNMDIADGTSRLHQGLRFSILINWDEIPLGSELTNMIVGYELNPLCFSSFNPLNQTLNSVNNKYPYKSTAQGSNIDLLRRAIKNIYINPQIMEIGKKYYLTAVLRNKDSKSQLTLFSKRDSDGATSNLESIVIDGDAANGSVRIMKGERFVVEINWDALKDGVSFLEMFEGYELDDLCLSSDNPLSEILASANWKYPYKIGSTGANIYILQRAIEDIFIDPQIVEAGKKYYLAAVRRNNSNESQLALFSKRDSDGATSSIESVVITGDAANGNVQIVKGDNFAVRINWDVIKNGATYTNMFDGYELDELCFSYDNPLYEVINSKKRRYPYGTYSTGKNITTLRRAIKNIFINPHIKEAGKKYYLAAVRRNNGNESQLSIYSKRTSDGATSLVESLFFVGDVANGSTQIHRGKCFAVRINWDAIKSNTIFTNMFDGYELDDLCFSYENELYTSISYAELIKSGSLPMNLNLFIKGYIDKRSGYLSTSAGWYSSDYIPVSIGDKIRYIGNLFGNGTIIGYPNKSPNGFVILHDTNQADAVDNKIVELTIPDGVNYIRVCVSGSNRCVLQWLEGRPPIFTKNIVTGGDLEVEAKTTTSQLSEVGILKLQNNSDIPKENNSLTLINGKLCLLVDNDVYELNMTKK